MITLWSKANLLRVLRNLPYQVNELVTHPGYVCDDLRKRSSLVRQRYLELKLLCSKAVYQVIKEKDIQLINYSMLSRLGRRGKI